MEERAGDTEQFRAQKGRRSIGTAMGPLIMMTTDLAIYPETLPAGSSPSRPDPVRARVTANSSYALANAEWRPEPVKERRGIHLLPDTRNPKPFGPHPGATLYWVTCLAGAGL